MFTYRIDLLNALGIDYQGWADFLEMRGKQYKRGPSFTIQDYDKAAEYCLSSNLKGLTCILVDNTIELTAWLQMKKSDPSETNLTAESNSGASHQQVSQQTLQSPDDSGYRIYRGVKYKVSKPNR